MKKETEDRFGKATVGGTKSEDVGRRNGVGETPGRRRFLQASLLGGAALAAGPVLQPVFAAPQGSEAAVKTADVPAFELDEITIAELQDGMKSGKHTAR